MHKLVPRQYYEYGIYANRKMFPSIDDGLIPVQRRILLGAYVIARNSYVKTTRLLGDVMGKWHPHTEQVGTVQWAVQNAFLDGNGWWGSKLGIEPRNCAAPRYTSVKLSKFTYELAFKYVEHVKWEPDELEPEPIYLPTIIPFSLICKYVQSLMGFGYRTVQPIFKFSDLIKRLYDKSHIPIPTIIGAECVTTKDEVRKLFETNKAVKVTFKPKGFIDKQNKDIYIVSCPEFPFRQMIKKFGSLWKNAEIGYVELPVSIKHKKLLSPDEAVYFKFSPAKRKSSIFDKMVNVFNNMEFSITFVNTLYDISKEKCNIYSLDEYMARTYNNYTSTCQTALVANIAKYKQIVRELEIIEAIRPLLSTVKLNQDIDEVITYLANQTNYTFDEINAVISKYAIKSLLRTRIDKSEYISRIKDLEHKQQHLEQAIQDDANQLIALRS